jgi:hypothetical protein
VNYTILYNEIVNDPKGLGISFDAEESALNNRNIAASLNAVGASGEIVEVGEVSNIEMQKAVIGAEFVLLNAVQQRAWLAILSLNTIPVKDTNIRNQVLEIWGVGTTTRANLGSLQSRSASRAEALFGEGVVVTSFDVHMARRAV